MNRHQRRAAAHRGQRVPPKTPNMRAFERELRENVKKLRPELTFLELLRDPDPAFAVCRIYDVSRTPHEVHVRLAAPVGVMSGPYTELVLEHFDALVALG